jgi:hypothetical protein
MSRPSRASRTRRSQETLEREMRADQNRSNRARLSSLGPSAQRATGLVRRVSPDPRAPVGAPSGSVLARQTGLSGTRSHGSRHRGRLSVFSEMLNRRNASRRSRVANSRPATSQNNVTNSVHAEPFAVEVQEAHSGPRPKRERIGNLPQAVPVRSFDSLFPTRVQEGTEYNLYDAYHRHAPRLHAERSRSRSRTRRRKRRSRSRSEPRRPRRAHSR